MDNGHDYAGKDLEAMSFASSYHKWILEVFRPHLGARVVEVGAGTGLFSEMLLELQPKSLSLIEPSKRMFDQLHERMRQINPESDVTTYNATFSEVAAEVRRDQRPDSVIYVNVLEHIDDDEAELGLVHKTLDKRGRLFIFVPALEWLFGTLDVEVGHFRRYNKRDIETKCRRAGFKIIQCRYFDLAGVAPWWINYRLLKLHKIQVGAVKLYDRYVVPVSKAFESRVIPPIGKNLLLIAEKSHE